MALRIFPKNPLKFYLILFMLFPLSSNALALKTLRYSDDGSPTTLDPVESATNYSNLVVTAVYDTLYEYKYLKIPYELRPNLADGEAQISPDGLTYTIKIKKGVYFIDDPAFKDGKGREVVAEDFVYSIKRHFDPECRSQGDWLWTDRFVGLDDWKKQGSNYEKEVEGLKALDRYTIQIKLVQPYPQFLFTLAMGYAGVIPKEAVLKYGREISVHPVGSGPYKIDSFIAQKAVLSRNPKFRKEKFDPVYEGYDKERHGHTEIMSLAGKEMPFLDVIEIDFVKQPIARWNSFNKSDEIQFASIPNELVDRTLKSKDPIVLNDEFAKKYHLSSSPEFGFVYSGFNMAKEDFGYLKDPKLNEDNRALRCAIRSAFNWPQRIQRFYYGIGKPYPGIIPPYMDDYSDLGNASIKWDPKASKKLLEDHGWNSKNLPIFTYSGVSSVVDKQIFEQTRGFLRSIGYPKSKIRNKQFATFGDYSKSIKNSELSYVALAWGLDYPDSENLMQLFYGPNASPGSNNTNFNNPTYNALYDKAKTMMPSPERKEIYRQMSEILINECVIISGFSRMRLYVWHKNVIMYPSRSPHGNLFKYFDVK